jgi:hypothetical protein
MKLYLAANEPVKDPLVPLPSTVLLPRVSIWVTVGQPFSPQLGDPIPIRLFVIVEFDIRTVNGAFMPNDGKTPMFPPVIRQLSRFNSALSPEARNPEPLPFETALLRAVMSDDPDTLVDLIFAFFLLIPTQHTHQLAFGIQILNAKKGSC